MRILTEQAPPSGQPSAPPSSTAPHATTSAPASQLPLTGRSDVAQGALAVGLPLLVLGTVAVVLARRRRAQTG